MSSGGDDRRVLLWHMEKAIHARSKPVKLKGEHLSNIFCLAFDSTNKKVFSGGKSEEKKKRPLISFYNINNNKTDSSFPPVFLAGRLSGTCADKRWI